VCGDGRLTGAEQCEDGNTKGGDGCEADCTITNKWDCEGGSTTSTTTCLERGKTPAPFACPPRIVNAPICNR